jgi:predicted exporter
MLKMVLLLIAGLNAAWFKVRIIPGLADQAAEQDATTEAKIVAWLSLLSWFGVLLLGRLIAYLGPG